MIGNDCAQHYCSECGVHWGLEHVKGCAQAEAARVAEEQRREQRQRERLRNAPLFHLGDDAYAAHVASFEAHNPHISHEKKAEKWGRIRYHHEAVDTAFEAWARGRAALLASMSAVIADATGGKARALPPIEARRVETGTGSMRSTKAG